MRVPFLIECGVPKWAEPLAIQVLLDTFARAFDVEAPRVRSMPQREALYAFREFSAACMDAALVSSAYSANKRAELEECARELGERVRWLLNPRDEELPELVSALYASIGIEVAGSIPGALRFSRCYFSGRYTPELCAFMSAFDSGFIGGLCGGGTLEFSARMTEGAPCCAALFGLRETGAPSSSETSVREAEGKTR